MKRIAIPALILAATLVVGACASGASNPMEGADQARTIRIHVQNQQFNDVTIYTVRGRQRLGVVAGKGEAWFETPWSYPDIRLLVRLRGGDQFTTEVMEVVPGDDLELILPPG